MIYYNHRKGKQQATGREVNMKKFAIVDEKGNVIFKSKSDAKAIGWMIFNAKYDPESETGTIADGRTVHFEVFAMA